MTVSAPYGSILVPTHDRSETLGAAIRAAANQSERNIEIIIVGDGCTPSCRAIAQDLCAGDSRVRFLDLPKAPMNGAANRDNAVREARSERIFYTDDDDLLLPNHVVTLGKALENCDVVDTPVASVSPNGRIDLGLHDTGNPRERRLLTEGRLKMVFDTHLTHRRSTYLELGAPWTDNVINDRPVWNMLHTFARNPGVQWQTLQRITALSFHGARRVTMPGEARQRELERWLKICAEPGIEGNLRERGSYSFHVFRSASALAESGLDKTVISETFHHHLCQLGEGNATQAKRAIDAVVAIVCNEEPDPEVTAEIFNDLLEARLGPVFPTRRIISRFAGSFELDVLESFIDPANESPAAFLAHLMICSKLKKDSTELIDSFEGILRAAAPEDRYGFALAAAEIITATKMDLELAWQFSEKARELMPQGRNNVRSLGLWRLRRKISKLRGDRRGRREADGMLQQLEDRPMSLISQIRK